MSFASKSIYVYILLLILVSCKTRKVVKPETPVVKTEIEKKTLATRSLKDFATDFIEAQNKSDFLYMQAEADYKDEKINQTIQLEVQVSNNNYIWLHAKVMFVNVARMLITPDSVRIINYLNREYISASYKYINKYSSIPLQYQQLQNMIYGNLLFEPNSTNINIDTSAAEILLRVLMDNAYQQSLHNRNNLKPVYVKLKDETSGRTLDVEYANFKTDGINQWPQKIGVHIKAEKKVDCVFSISNLATSKIKEPQFAIPKTYQVKVY